MCASLSSFRECRPCYGGFSGAACMCLSGVYYMCNCGYVRHENAAGMTTVGSLPEPNKRGGRKGGEDHNLFENKRCQEDDKAHRL